MSWFPSQFPPDSPGYPSLSRWTATIPGYEGYVFRKFDRLSARNLFHLESEIAHLEHQLDTLDREIYEGNSPSENMKKRTSVYDWVEFQQRSQQKRSTDNARMRLIRKISLRLEKYHQALLLQTQVTALQPPRQRQLGIVQRYFFAEERDGTEKRRLGNLDYYRLDQTDLVALKPPPEDDLLSRFLERHGWIKPTVIDGDIEYISQKYISRLAAVITALLATVLLLGAIVTLRLVKASRDVRLILIVVFTIAFALSLGLLTNARRGEVLAGTAAYAAVLVVFVSSDLGPD